MSVLHVAVRGQVQGVGFRWFVRERARALGLSGWVRNEPDGSVEVFAIGPDGQLATLRKLLEEGPAAARVQHVIDQDRHPSAPALSPFGVLR